MDMIRVAVVDDEPLVRSGLRLILSSAADIEVVAEAATGAEAVAGWADWQADVVLMDIRMPGLDGVTATAQITAEPAAPQILVLTAFDTDDYILDALAAGATGFLLKDTPPAELTAAVRSAAAGTRAVSPAVLTSLLELAGRSRARTDPLAGLSEREREIAEAVADGLSNAEICQRLFLSLSTVKTYLGRIFDKLGVTSRVQLAILVLESR
ncbi:response regulator [Brevibacterium otitidis]|uniref:Response regulator n=1 Tax=Brevibacterium otitidis TaxID=53364 RepID=A0ABV5X187_9MICO|nr:response regulator transcription factor [Brevibacterium otitidis]BFF08574.1 response regulator transcription factor [Brevibacterium otitidis]